MISICIPVFNFNITSLVEELSIQADALSQPYEIIIIDDGSENYKEINKKIAERFNYIELSKNIGRAKIRNLFLKYSRYDYLLFLDCDSSITKPDFLSTYLKMMRSQPGVVVGGRVYEKKRPERNKRLRWKYGTFRESKSAAIRNKHPYASFMTNNFLIPKKILEETGFDERLIKYGHEDTLFGFSLRNKKYPVFHIENPVLNGDIESNIMYLHKTRESVHNLAGILGLYGWDKDLIDGISLLKFYIKIQKWKNAIYFLFQISQPMILKMLRNGYINLFMYDFYKLGILIQMLESLQKEKNHP